MINKIKNWLNRPYYSQISNTYNIIVSVAIGIVVSLFLIIFQPFRIHLLGENLVIFCLGYGLIAILSVNLVLYTIPKIFKDYYNPDSRTILKQLILLNLVVLVSATISYPYHLYIRNSINQEQIAGYFLIITQTYSIGLFPILLWLYYDEQQLRKKRKINTEKINKDKNFRNEVTDQEEIITLKSEKSNNIISIDINKIVYISSEGNYASFFIHDVNGLKENIFRVTLSQIIKELNGYKNIVRCHKSYIINTRYIKEYSGNARGYLIKTTKSNLEIPVSRKFKKEDLEKILEY